METKEPTIQKVGEELAPQIDETAEAVSTLSDDDLLIVAGGPWIQN